MGKDKGGEEGGITRKLNFRKPAAIMWQAFVFGAIPTFLWHNLLASPKSSSRQMRAAPPEADDPQPARSVVKLSCQLLSLLGMHSPHCVSCKAQLTYGEDISKRLEELNCWTQPHSPNVGNRADSNREEVVSAPIILRAQKRRKERQDEIA